MDDINNQAKDRRYFLGTLLFEEKENKRDFKHLHIVDGQQRVTTLIIFMNCLIENLKSSNVNGYDRLYRAYIVDDEEPKLRTIDPDDVFFQTYILKDGEHQPVPETPSQRRLLEAKKYFSKILKKYTLQHIEEIREKIENTLVLTYSIQGSAEATLIFETINDRGKKLTNLESIKSFLMHKVYLCAKNPEAHLGIIQGHFSKIYRICEELQEKVDEDDILRYHFIAFEKWEDDEFDDTKQAVKNLSNQKFAKSKKDTLDFVENFTRQLKESFEIVKSLERNELKISQIDDIWALRRTANIYPLLIKTYKEDETKGKEKFTKIANILEKFIFRAYAISGKKTNTARSQFYRLSRDFKSDYKTLERDIKDMCYWWAIEEEFQNKLQSPKLYEITDKPDLNYLFWKYENSLRGNGKGEFAKMTREEYESTNSKTKMTIEHIASQNPEENPSQMKMTKEFREKYLHGIGNLTIAPKSDNSSMSNSEFKEKKGYFNKAPLMCQNELESFLSKGKWTENSIENRSKKIIDFSKEYWTPK